MSVLFTCAQGHQWQSEPAGAPGATTQEIRCPHCGAGAIVPRPTVTKAPEPSRIRSVRPAPAAETAEAPTVPPRPAPSTLDKFRTIPPAATSPARSVRAAPSGPPGYEILRELGRGGMGVVYKARQVALKRLVALKMILAGSHAGPEDLLRFRVEAEAVARLQHRNIVQIHDVGEHEGLPFFSLEFVRGGSLDKKLAGTPQPAEQAAQLMATLARAMHHAHRRNILHRDLKPANVLLTTTGVPKIADFGLAKQLEAETGRTRSGAVMGTPSYMAPEQAEGKKDIGPPADIYALGAILYEMLTGRPPFRAQTALDTVIQVVSDEPVPPRRLNPKAPRDLETICLKCLRKEPARRFASAKELAEDLDRFLAGEPIRARPVGRLERAWKQARRRPVLAVCVILIALGSLIGIIDTIMTRSQLSDLFGDMPKLPNLKAPATGNQGKEPDAAARTTQLLVTARGHNRGVWGVAISPDGKRLASAGDDRTVRLWDAQSGKLLQTLGPLADAVAAVTFSPDGKTLASAGHDATVVLWNADTGKEMAVLRGHTRRVWCLAFSPDRKHLASGGDDRLIKIWDVEQRKEVRRLEGHTDNISGLAYSPDGSQLAAASWDGTVSVWDAIIGARTQTFRGHSGRVRCLAFSPDKKQIASAGDDGMIRIWDPANAQEVRTGRGHGADVHGIAYHPSGRYLASADSNGLLRIWDLSADELGPPRGDQVISLQARGAAVTGIAFSGDGRRLAAGAWDKTVRVWATELEKRAALEAR